MWAAVAAKGVLSVPQGSDNQQPVAVLSHTLSQLQGRQHQRLQQHSHLFLLLLSLVLVMQQLLL